MAKKAEDCSFDDGELCIAEPEDVEPSPTSIPDEGAPELLYVDEKKWPNDGPGNIILRVFFTQQPPPETNEEKILGEMRGWSEHCGVKFEKAEYLDQSDIRISFEKGYSRTIIGTDANLPKYKGKPTMNLGKVDKRTILHETGHALGLVHEHQHPEGKIRWDTEKLIEDLTDRGPKWSPDRIKRNIITPHKKSKVKGSKKMDPESIMAYLVKERWVENASDPAIRQLFKRNTKLSSQDKKIIGEMYPKPTIVLDSDSSSDDDDTGGRIETDAGSKSKPHQLKSNGSKSEAADFPHTSPDVPKPVGASNDKQPHFVFNSKHLAVLFRKLLPQANKWKSIGTLLDVPRLNIIGVNNSDADGALREMLSTWLKQINPLPTKEKLVQAIESATNDSELAQEINNMKFPSN